MSTKSKLIKFVAGAAIIEVLHAEVPESHVEFVLDRPQSLANLVHTHQHYEGTFGEYATAIATTSTGSQIVSAGSVSGFTPRFPPIDRF